MALMKKKDQIPKDAVLMDEMEATNYAWDIIYDWNISETWALRYSPLVLGGINSLSGLLINQHYRNKLKLGNYGHFSSLIPLCLLSGTFTALFHRQAISTNMLLMKNDACPICYEVRSAVIQLGFGIAYPMILAPVSAFMFANRYNTFRVPSLIENTKGLFKFAMKISRPLKGTLIYLGAAQVAVSSFCTYFEMKNNIAVRKTSLEIEKKLRSEGLL